MLHSGHEEVNASHTQGFAVILFKGTQKALTEWGYKEPIT